MNLHYNTTQTGLGNTQMYNGNISAMQWRVNLGLSDTSRMAYTFGYDAMNRLTNTTPKVYDTQWRNGNSYLENNLEYDLNGNIKKLQRTGANGVIMDDLDYKYGDNNTASNQLLKVSDIAGFTEAADVHDDYAYDRNGNMTIDNNKSINGIAYNILNLPGYVSKATGESILYHYDATGRKLSQIVRDATGVQKKVTDYHGEYIYENDTLKFVNNEEGRVILTDAEPEYQYHLKDHLGNVRMTFTTKEEVDSVTATLEDANAVEEEANLLRYNLARRIRSHLFDHTNNDAQDNSGYAQRLNGSENERIGLAKSLSVMPGDVVKAEVYAKYVDFDTGNWEAALQTLMGYIATPGTAPPGTIKDGTGYSNSGVTPLGITPMGHGQDTENGVPKAYLNFIYINRNFDISSLRVLYQRITEAGREDGSDGPHDHLTLEETIKEAGYVYVYLSNDGEGVREVYFDDFKVEHIKGPVVSSQDYFPFGLTFNPYSRERAFDNMYQYNGKEKQDELDLGWLDYGARMYSPELGRWSVVDPMGELSRRWSPYVYVYDNPTRFVDPDGMVADEFGNQTYSGFQDVGAGGWIGYSSLDGNTKSDNAQPPLRKGKETPKKVELLTKEMQIFEKSAKPIRDAVRQILNSMGPFGDTKSTSDKAIENIIRRNLLMGPNGLVLVQTSFTKSDILAMDLPDIVKSKLVDTAIDKAVDFSAETLFSPSKAAGVVRATNVFFKVIEPNDTGSTLEQAEVGAQAAWNTFWANAIANSLQPDLTSTQLPSNTTLPKQK